ncbi:MAG: hypothetical protein WDN03_09740 [Rhizomicrobium sp.]
MVTPADDPAGRHHRVAAAQIVHHLAVLLGALLLRADHQEIHDRENEDQRRDRGKHLCVHERVRR